MIIETNNHKKIFLEKLDLNNTGKLSNYLQQLSDETKKRFGPHPFDERSILDLYTSSDNYLGYIAIDIETAMIIAYSIIKTGYLEHDRPRLESYGITLNKETDCTFAPSVADQWQSMGIGKKLFQFILSDLKAMHIKRIILWGGVQVNNEKAVKYYLQNGFNILGQFYYQGENYDMTLDIF